MSTRWARRRQLFVIGILAGIFLAGVFVVYIRYFTPEPTCFDGKQNQEELGVDCGGPCERLCPFQTRPIVALWSRALPVTDTTYHLVAYVENPNAGARTERLQYRFRAYDADNVILGERTGETFIAPLERTAIFVPYLEVADRKPARVFFDVVNQPVWHTTESVYTLPRIGITRQVANETGGSVRVSAQVRNNYPFTIHDVEFVALVYGRDENALLASQTILDRFERDEVRDIVFTWPRQLDESIGRIEIIPRVDIREIRALYRSL